MPSSRFFLVNILRIIDLFILCEWVWVYHNALGEVRGQLRISQFSPFTTWVLSNKFKSSFRLGG